MSDEPKLTERQRKYALAVTRGLSGAAAARTAGYTAQTASQVAWALSRDRRIERYIETLKDAGLAGEAA